MSIEQMLMQSVENALDKTMKPGIEKAISDFHFKVENLQLYTSDKLVYSKTDLFERWGIHSWKGLQEKIIDTGILPAGQAVYGGVKVFWMKSDVEKADKAVLELFGKRSGGDCEDLGEAS